MMNKLLVRENQGDRYVDAMTEFSWDDLFAQILSWKSTNAFLTQLDQIFTEVRFSGFFCAYRFWEYYKDF